MSSYSEIYFAVLSVSTIAIAGLLLAILFYALSVLRDIKKMSEIAKREAESVASAVARGASILGAGLSSEAAGFVKTVFSLLISKAVEKKSKKKSSSSAKKV